MKKKRTKGIALCMVVAMVLACFTSVTDSLARRETQTISDSFDDSEFVGGYDADKWTFYGAENGMKVEELVKAQKVLKGETKNITGEWNVLMSKDWYWEIRSFTFDMYMPANTTWDNSKWAFMDFVDIEDPMEYVGDYDDYGEPMCYGAMKVVGEDDFGISSTTWKDWGFNSETIGDTWLSVKVVSENATRGKLIIAPRGQAFDETKAQDITLAGNKSFYNSNIVLGDYKFAGYMFDNLVIETDTGTYKEDFEDGKNDLFEEIVIRDAKKNTYEIVDYNGNNHLTFENAAAGDRLIANTKIIEGNEYVEDTDKVLDVSFKVNYKNNNTSEEIAYIFGLDANDASPFSDNYALIFGKNNVRLSYFDIEGKETIHVTKRLGAGLRGNTVSLALTKAGELTVRVDGAQVLKHSGLENYGGYAGIAAKTDITAKIHVDDIVMNNTYFEIITTKSWSDDFSSNRIGTGTDTDYAWNAERGNISVSEEELVFTCLEDGSYFGPAYKYETFEMSFEMTSILTTDDEKKSMEATNAGCWIGLDFGKKSPTVKTYATYGMLAVRVAAPEGGAEWTEAESFLYHVESSDLEDYVVKHTKPIPKSYFENISYDDLTKRREEISPEDAVCFKFVALDNKVELYMKLKSEAEYTLYTTVENVDPKGYVALACTGYAYWTIDNFEIKNTTEIYNEAPEIVIPEKVIPTLAERGLGVEDTYWAKEQKLNEGKAGISPIVLIAGVSGVALIGIAVFVVYQVQKKKRTKSVEDN